MGLLRLSRAAAVRAVAILVLALVAAGCGGTAERADPAVTFIEDFSTVDDEERRRFDRRIARDLEEGRARRARALARNRRFLDSLPAFSGAELVAESHSWESREPLSGSEELEYHVYASSKLSIAQFRLIESDDWGTFRFFRLPLDASTSEVQRYYARLFRGWTHFARERGTGGSGVQLFADNYWRPGTCAWVHIGFNEHGDISQARTLVLATDSRPRAECV